MKYFLYTILIFFYCQFCFSQNKVTTGVIPTTVNSKYQDVRPIISDDGKTLFFSRRYHPENQKGEKDLQDVWKSTIDANGNYAKAKNIGEPYNDKKANDIIRVSQSGDSMVFYNEDYKGVGSTLALFYKNNKSAQEMEIDGYYNKSPYFDFDYNFKHKVILMAVDRKDSKGDQDLYYSIYQDNTKTYSTPMSLGPIINSTKADFSPFLTMDGNTLFFVSYGHSGQGGADIFMSQRQSEAWDDWSKPENLGNIINSPYEETFVSIDPSLKFLYYDSYPAGATNRDIWKATLSDDIVLKIKNSATNKKAYVAGVTPNTKVPKQDELGQVDSSSVISKEPIVEEVTVATNTNEEEEEEAAEQSQSVFTTSYEETASASSEIKPEEAPTNLPSPKGPEELNFFERIGEKIGIGSSGVAEIALVDFGRKGKKVDRNVYFDFDSDKYQIRYNSLLRAIVVELEANPELKLIIEGHTDGIGGEDINKDLSCRRAKNIKNALLNYGLAEGRLEISCEGKERPMASNDDEFEGRELNRRVEFYLF